MHTPRLTRFAYCFSTGAPATSTPSAPVVSPKPTPYPGNSPKFAAAMQDAARKASWAPMMIGDDWYGNGDTVVAMEAVEGALDIARGALAKHPAPAGAITEARSGIADLSRAYELMRDIDDRPPVEARPFLSQGIGHLDKAAAIARG